MGAIWFWARPCGVAVAGDGGLGPLPSVASADRYVGI